MSVATAGGTSSILEDELMGRRELREQIFKLLFRIEFNRKEDMPEQLQFFFEDDEKKVTEKDQDYITEKYGKIVEQLPEIDRKINKLTTGWTTERMGKVDLTILRLAVFEVVYDEDVPTGVAINEAVEIGKKFGQDETPAFVNGVLAKFAKEEDAV